MGHEVNLDITGRRVVSVPEGADRNRSAHRRTHSGATALPAASHNTHLRQEAIHRRCADRQQLVAKLAIHIKLAMPLKRRQQDGDRRLQSFRAEAVGRLPQHHQSLSNLSAITGGMPPIGRRLSMPLEFSPKVPK
ncbi:hypothetical protein NKI82_33525 [Mesorhizobium sp. M0482]|uniref:hypothetical protein n=1 Tax=Mesorhizobium sp. M0482 TaxID=2956948 RepID=UPI00333843F0